jgi:hypothetical protein
MNMLGSHPDLCLLSGETQEVFRGNKKRKLERRVRRLFDVPLRFASKPYLLALDCIDQRHSVSGPLKHYIDLVFYVDKLISRKNVYKSENVRYTLAEKMKTPFLVSNMNGNVLATDLFSAMYPDATFIAIVRNGLAICEGHIRRRHSAEAFGQMYEAVCQKMIHDSQTVPRYHLVRFEDMISNPIEFMEKIYSYAGLDMSQVKKVRLRAKASMSKDGVRRHTFGGRKDWEYEWFHISEMKNILRGDVNENQINRLSEKDKKIFLEQAGESMRSLGYV